MKSLKLNNNTKKIQINVFKLSKNKKKQKLCVKTLIVEQKTDFV